MLVVISKSNIASMAIYEELKILKPDINFYFTDKSVLEFDVNQEDADYIIVASTHKSKGERKTLTVHPTGNFGKAEMGGEDRTLSKVSSHLLKVFFQELQKQTEDAKIDYEVTMEATHHGPYINKPSLFIEIGSTEKEWKDKKAAEVIAKTIIKASKRFDQLKKEKPQWKTVIAFGGGHYCPSFNKHQLQETYSISHICPKHSLEQIDKAIVKQAINSTEEKVEVALLDWKGLSGYKEKIIKILDDIRITYQRV